MINTISNNKYFKLVIRITLITLLVIGVAFGAVCIVYDKLLEGIIILIEMTVLYILGSILAKTLRDGEVEDFEESSMSDLVLINPLDDSESEVSTIGSVIQTIPCKFNLVDYSEPIKGTLHICNQGISLIDFKEDLLINNLYSDIKIDDTDDLTFVLHINDKHYNIYDLSKIKRKLIKDKILFSC